MKAVSSKLQQHLLLSNNVRIQGRRTPNSNYERLISYLQYPKPPRLGTVQHNYPNTQYKQQHKRSGPQSAQSGGQSRESIDCDEAQREGSRSAQFLEWSGEQFDSEKTRQDNTHPEPQRSSTESQSAQSAGQSGDSSECKKSQEDKTRSAQSAGNSGEFLDSEQTQQDAIRKTTHPGSQSAQSAVLPEELSHSKKAQQDFMRKAKRSGSHFETSEVQCGELFDSQKTEQDSIRKRTRTGQQLTKYAVKSEALFDSGKAQQDLIRKGPTSGQATNKMDRYQLFRGDADRSSTQGSSARYQLFDEAIQDNSLIPFPIQQSLDVTQQSTRPTEQSVGLVQQSPRVTQQWPAAMHPSAPEHYNSSQYMTHTTNMAGANASTTGSQPFGERVQNYSSVPQPIQQWPGAMMHPSMSEYYNSSQYMNNMTGANASTAGSQPFGERAQNYSSVPQPIQQWPGAMMQPSMSEYYNSSQYMTNMTGTNASTAGSQPSGERAQNYSSVHQPIQHSTGVNQQPQNFMMHPVFGEVVQDNPPIPESFQHGVIVNPSFIENYNRLQYMHTMRNMANMGYTQPLQYSVDPASSTPQHRTQGTAGLSPQAPAFTPYNFRPKVPSFQPSGNRAASIQSMNYSTRRSASPYTNSQKTQSLGASSKPQQLKPGLNRPSPTKEYLQQSQMPMRYSKQSKPLLLVIDLNGTILFRPNKNNPTKFKERPFTNGFLTYALDNHKVMIWSSARPHNVSAMCNKLFPDGKKDNLVAEWHRGDLDLTDSEYKSKVQVYKRLGRVWADDKIQATYPQSEKNDKGEEAGRWDQSNTVLIDDSLEKARPQPHNLIQLPEFTGKNMEDDTVLAVLIDYLNILKKQVDVSAYIRKIPFEYEVLKAQYSAAGYEDENEGDSNDGMSSEEEILEGRGLGIANGKGKGKEIADRPYSVAANNQNVVKEDTLGYVRNVTQKVNVDELKATLEKFGELVYFDANPNMNCVFVEFATAAGQKAAQEASPHILSGENIYVEPRRQQTHRRKTKAYDGKGYNDNITDTLDSMTEKMSQTSLEEGATKENPLLISSSSSIVEEEEEEEEEEDSSSDDSDGGVRLTPEMIRDNEEMMEEFMEEMRQDNNAEREI